MNYDDHSLRKLFKTVTEQTAQKAPPFDKMWMDAVRKFETRRRKRRKTVLRIAASILLIITGWSLNNNFRGADELEIEITNWRSPTNELLKPHFTLSQESAYQSSTDYLLLQPISWKTDIINHN